MPRIPPVFDESINPDSRVIEDQEPEGPQLILCICKMWQTSWGGLESLEVMFYDDHEILWQVKYDGALVAVGGSLWEEIGSLYERAKRLPLQDFDILWSPAYDPNTKPGAFPAMVL